MARIINDEQGSQSHQADEGHLTVLQVDGQSSIKLPEGDFLSHGDILRDGQDLILQSSDGRELVIEDYFSAGTSPVLTTPQGSQLTPELVQSFVKSQTVELAANETGSDASGVGIIKEVSGDATITRADGTSEKVTLGTAVHQGDIIETAAQGAVNIVFLDESTFAISNNARMAIDEYVFDPSTQAGETNVSILRGMFVFTSGLIGRDDPDDVQIETPVGSIGIRGTTIAGHINPNGESQITVVEGAIVIKNGNTSVTLADQYETVKLTGFDAPIQMAGTLDANAMKASYGVLGTVAPAFMNTLNTEPADKKDAADESDADAPADGDAPAEDAPPADEQGQVEAEQPVVASYDIFSDPLNTGFDLSVAAQPVNPFDTNTVVAASLLGASALQLGPIGSLSAAPVIVEASTGVTLTAAVEPPPLLPLEIVVEIAVDENAIAGDVVGRIFTTIAFPNVDIRFANVPLENGEPVFELVMVSPGVYNVVLTDAGEDAVLALAGTSGTSLGNVDVVAVLPDGRTTTTNTPTNYGDYTTVAPPAITPAPILQLDSLSANDGYRIIGPDTQSIGDSSAYLGDYNRDGMDDFAIGALNYNFVDIPNTGAGVITAAAEVSISGGGDINGDGNLDFAVGSGYYNTNQGSIRLHSGANPNGAATNNIGATGDLMGSSVAMIDFTGDGYADVFNGAKGVGGGEGAVSVFLGYAGFSFTGLTYAGFANGVGGGNVDSFGLNMAGIRDFNNDGYGDLAVAGMTSATSGYVNLYMGNSTGSVGTMYTITVGAVDSFDIPVYDLGDMNGDGYSDILIGETGFNAGSGRALVYAGGAGPTQVLDIRAAAGSTLVGGGSAGDFNGDGYSDIVIATQTGNIIDTYVIYGNLALGGTITLDATWLANNRGEYAHMQLNLSGHGLPADFGLESIGIGDQNGDGYDDMLITSPDLFDGDGGYYVVYGRADPFDLAGPDPEVHTDVNFNSSSTANAGFDMISSSNNDGLVGSSANNIMANLNGATIHTGVSFKSGSGDDLINVHGSGGNLARVIEGGDNFDVLNLLTTGNVDFRNISEFTGIEEVVFGGAAAQSMTIGLNDVFSLLQTSQEMFNASQGLRHTVYITNSGTGTKELIIDAPGAVNNMVSAGFTQNGTYNDGTSTYDIYVNGGGYQLLIEQGVTVTVQ